MRFLKNTPFIILLFLLAAATTKVGAQDTSYARRMASLTDIKVPYNAAVVDDYIRAMLRSPLTTAEAIGRYQHYKPLVDSILMKYGLPSNMGLIILGNSMADCSYSDDDGRSGPWAMQYNVGRLWDLKMNTYIDERRDIEKSTYAAVKYMKELYLLYNDPALAMAAFATTTVTLNKHIRLAGNNFDYWSIHDSLPQQAKDIVPNYLAAVYVYNFHTRHGILAKPYVEESYDTIRVGKWQSFDDMAASLNTTPKILRELNPQFKQGIVPMSPVPYLVKLPRKSKGLYKTIDSLSFKPYSMNPYIEEIPELEDRNLPIKKAADTAQSKAGSPNAPAQGNQPKLRTSTTVTHVVQRGEGLGIIAQKYGVKVDEIKKWNDIKGFTIYPGQKLVIHQKD